MEIFDDRLRPPPGRTDAERAATNKPTEDTFNNPEMTYYIYDPPDPNPNRIRPPIQGLDGLLYWLSGDPTPETDGYVHVCSALTSCGTPRENLSSEVCDRVRLKPTCSDS